LVPASYQELVVESVERAAIGANRKDDRTLPDSRAFNPVHRDSRSGDSGHATTVESAANSDSPSHWRPSQRAKELRSAESTPI
jgi:hypothetical protein